MSDLPHLMIATPCKDGRVDVNYAVSLAASAQILTEAGVKFTTATACTASIDNARSTLAGLFMKSACTHLLFIDDDMAWASDLPLRLLNENLEIVGVACRKKLANPEFNIHHDNPLGSLQDRPWLVKVNAIGTGVMLIKREVFDKLEPHVPLYNCYSGSGEPQRLYFRHELVNDGNQIPRYESEDFYFCRLARQHGFDIFGYVDESVPHIGRRSFSGAYSAYLKFGVKHGFTSDRPRYYAEVVGIEKGSQ